MIHSFFDCREIIDSLNDEIISSAYFELELSCPVFNPVVPNFRRPSFHILSLT